MDRLARLYAAPLLIVILCLCKGCASPYYADRGALVGGLTGAGAGALVGHAAGNTLAGAAIGGGLGAVTGAAIGSGMDEAEARNRAMIEQALQRRVAPGAATIEDVIAMTRAGVREDLIVTHVRANGLARPLQAADLITLQQQGVSPNVIRAMQEVPLQPVPAQPVMVAGPPPGPVIVEEYGYPAYWRPYHYYPYPYYPGPRVGFGVSIRH